VYISNLSSCAGELSVYLQNFDNWDEPIIPPEPGCPVPVYDPEYFTEGSTGWFCMNTNKGACGLDTSFNQKCYHGPINTNRM